MIHQTYGYVRVSTGRQADEGHSLDAQTQKIRQYAALKDLGHPVIYCDAAVSAAKQRMRERPQGDHVLSLVQAGDHLVITKLDRAFRNASDALAVCDELRARNVTLHIIDFNIDTSTPMGRLFLTLLAAFAEWEAAMIRERTLAGQTEAKRKGVHINRPPRGFTHGPDGRLHILPRDLAQVATLLRMKQAGWPYAKRYVDLDRLGFTTAKGLPFDKKRLMDSTEDASRSADLIEGALKVIGLVVVCDDSLRFRQFSSGALIDPWDLPNDPVDPAA